MIYNNTVPIFTKMLNNLDGLFDKAASFADQKKFDITVLLEARLAPDQFNLLRQVQIACDTAKFAASRLTGKTAPSFDDNEKSLSEIRARIKNTIKYLETFSAPDFAEAAERKITTPRWDNQYLNGNDYVLHHVIPNFYFHMTTAYSILRHNGVDVGKKDFLGTLPFRKD